jgi:HSP20 family protein
MEVRFNDGWTGGRPHQWFFNRVNELVNPEYTATRPDHEVPPADVVESEDGYHFYFEMPGVKADTLAVRIDDGTLIVEAERPRPEHPSTATMHRGERRYGKFYRAFRLPEQYASEQVTANYKDGVLELKIAKPAQAKPVKIQVNLN